MKLEIFPKGKDSSSCLNIPGLGGQNEETNFPDTGTD